MANETAYQVLDLLRINIDNRTGDGWATVYLDNARPAGMSVHQFRAALAQLAKEGFYKPIDRECFGSVKMRINQEEAHE
jgi:hypothetical protein